MVVGAGQSARASFCGLATALSPGSFRAAATYKETRPIRTRFPGPTVIIERRHLLRATLGMTAITLHLRQYTADAEASGRRICRLGESTRMKPHRAARPSSPSGSPSPSSEPKRSRLMRGSWAQAAASDDVHGALGFLRKRDFHLSENNCVAGHIGFEL